MAIKLAKVLDNGFEANYWRVLNVQADADSRVVSGMAVVYKDRASRDAEHKPVHPPMLYNFIADDVFCNLWKLAYDHLKKTQLNGGEDE